MMTAGHFRENHVSSGDLNRPPESRGSQTSGVLLVLFVQAKRIKPFPFRELSRFCKPRISPLKQQLPTNKIKSFAAPRQLFPYFLLGTKSMEKNFSALRRCPFRDSTLRVLFGAFCVAKSIEKRPRLRRNLFSLNRLTGHLGTKP